MLELKPCKSSLIILSFSQPDPILEKILLALVPECIPQSNCFSPPSLPPLWSSPLLSAPGWLQRHLTCLPGSHLSPQESELPFYTICQITSLFCSKPCRGFASHTERQPTRCAAPLLPWLLSGAISRPRPHHSLCASRADFCATS